MTSAYGVFANEGVRHPYTSILEIQSLNKPNLYTHEDESEEVLEAEVTRSISDILSDNRARTPAFGADSYLHFPNHDVAVKTGTTNDYRDAWIIGYTPEISVGAWAGNNTNEAMEKKVAGFIIAPMWNEFMNFYFEKYPDSTDFIPPEEIDPTLKGVLNGYKPNMQVENGTSTEDSNTEKRAHSILHYVNKDDPRGPFPNNPASDPQYPYWEYGVLLWSVTQGDVSIFDVIKQNDENDEENRPILKIRTPDSNERVRKNEIVEVSYIIESKESVSRVEYFIDGNKIGSDEGNENSFFFIPEELDLDKGEYTFLVVAYTKTGVRGGASVDFRVR